VRCINAYFFFTERLATAFVNAINGYGMNIILSLFTAVLSYCLIKLFYRVAQNTKLVDKPNERSMHSSPMISGVGVVFISLVLLFLPLLCFAYEPDFSQIIILMICIILLASISFIDDLFQLSAKSRFIVQAIVSLLAVIFMRPEELNFILFIIVNPLIMCVFLFFVIIWAINHFNFMDGMDGLCALQAIFLLAAYAFLLSFHPAALYEQFCWVLISSLIGFLFFNFPPAKLFMGDVGSASLGLITFAIAVIGQQKFQIPILYWFILNGLFLFDATVTLLRRVINNEKWFAAHRKHAYQRLKLYGVGARTILFWQAVINIGFFVAVYMVHNNTINASIVVCVQLIVLSVIYYQIEKIAPMYVTSEPLLQ